MQACSRSATPTRLPNAQPAYAHPEPTPFMHLQRWLAIPYAGSRSEDELVRHAADGSGQCTDPDFPPAPQSLYADLEHPPPTAPCGADWKRVNGVLYVPTTQALKVLPVRARVVSGSSSALLEAHGGVRRHVISMQIILHSRWHLGAVAVSSSRRNLVPCHHSPVSDARYP
jgi:hypothetical protein